MLRLIIEHEAKKDRHNWNTFLARLFWTRCIRPSQCESLTVIYLKLIPRINATLYGNCSFSVSGPTEWSGVDYQPSPHDDLIYPSTLKHKFQSRWRNQSVSILGSMGSENASHYRNKTRIWANEKLIKQGFWVKYYQNQENLERN